MGFDKFGRGTAGAQAGNCEGHWTPEQIHLPTASRVCRCLHTGELRNTPHYKRGRTGCAVSPFRTHSAAAQPPAQYDVPLQGHVLPQTPGQHEMGWVLTGGRG